MSKLDDYLQEAEQDTVLDVFNVKDVQSKLPAIKHKWVGRLIRAKRKLNQLQQDKQDSIEKLLKEAKKQSLYKVSEASLLKSIDRTDTIKELNRSISDYKIIIEFLERTEKVFSSMTFDIKNLTEIMKLETL